MEIKNNINLKPLNTFAIEVLAENWVELNSFDDLTQITNDESIITKKIMGGGSNVLFTKDQSGLIIHNCLKGIEQVNETANHVYLSVASGEIWHEFVLYTLEQNLSGIENLALIPGTVGAAPIQNIGAYGVEVKDLIHSVTFWHWEHKKFQTFTNEECFFAYRDSVFKSQMSNQFFITSVVFKLNKNHFIRTDYGAINEELNKQHIVEPSPHDVANAVIAIRSSKLPNPQVIGNAGSFFKNPTIPIAQFDIVKLNFPSIPSYPVGENYIKIPAAWLIEQCNWKGFREKDFGVHTLQALVLVNYGTAKGDEILSLSERIIHSVKEKFGIQLEREVQIW